MTEGLIRVRLTDHLPLADLAYAGIQVARNDMLYLLNVWRRYDGCELATQIFPYTSPTHRAANRYRDPDGYAALEQRIATRLLPPWLDLINDALPRGPPLSWESEFFMWSRTDVSFDRILPALTRAVQTIGSGDIAVAYRQRR